MRSSYPQVLVVEASAGSGKTYALSKRYVQLSLRLAAAKETTLQSILAITFTNKATWEMKSRILDFFKRIALKQLKPFEIEDILKPLGLDEHDASRLAFDLMNDIIRQYHYFQVQTIDSFVNILLVGCSFKIGLSAGFKIQRNSKEYLELSLDELLDQASRDKQVYKLFENFVRQYLFLENRSGWFPREDLLKVISELFRQYNTYQKSLLVYPLTEDSFVLKRKIFCLMQEIRDNAPAQTRKQFLDHIDSLLENGNGVFDIDELGNYWARQEFPVNKGGEVTPKLEGLWRKAVSQIQDLCLVEARGMFNPYVEVFDRVLSSFWQLSRRDDVLFLEELNRKAALLFEDNLVTVEELYFRLAARLQHYLIDEFQDTSLAQWRNLSPMVQEALAHGGSLFYVGDKKQAIFSFRGGESRLFDALQVGLKSFNVELTQLDRNFRSCPEIIKFNNEVFSLDNLNGFLTRRRQDALENKRSNEIDFSQEDFNTIAATFAHAHQTPGKDLKGGVVRVFPLDGRTKEERSQEVRQQVIALVKDARQRFALRDIAILTRGNHEAQEITQWLLSEGIGASSDRNSDIKNNELVVQLIDLLTFLDSPIDNNAFAQFCLGELVLKATGLEASQLRDFLFNCARASSKRKELYFYKEFREAFPKVWEDFFEEFLRQVGVSPLYELTAAIIQRFGCEQFFPQYQGFLMHFLELIKRQEKESCDLTSFLDYYNNLEGEERFVPMSQVDAVKILTVHKSKGLEFPVVILPFLEMDVKASSGGRDGGQAYIPDIQEEGMHLVRIKEKYRQFCPKIQEMYNQEYKKSFLVELNSVYVAFTRAIEELYVFVPSRVGNTVNPAKFLIPEHCWGLGTPSGRPLAHEKLEAHHRIKAFVSNPWKALREDFMDEPAVSALLARRGEFYHALLMHIGAVKEGHLDQAIQAAWDKTTQLFPQLSSFDVIPAKAGILSFINRDDIRPFFYLPAKAQIFCEKEFVNKFGDTRRIDRLIVLKDDVWVVDYKLSSVDEALHQKQMKEYVELVKQFYPKHKIQGQILYLNLHL